MNQTTDNFNSVENQQQAIGQFMGEQFIEWLMDYVGTEVRSWPELKAIEVAKPKIERIRKFMLQRFVAAEAFIGGKDGDPGFLGFAIANLSESDDPLAEGALTILEKKRQEEISGPRGSGGKIFHRTSWIKLLTALGVTSEELGRAEPKEVTRNYIAELSDIYSNSEWPTAMGAFAAHERAIPEEYSAIAAMLKANTQLSDSDLGILNWHVGLDYKYVVNTAHVLDKIVFDQENKDLVFEGVKRQLSTRKDFYAGLLKHLES